MNTTQPTPAKEPEVNLPKRRKGPRGPQGPRLKEPPSREARRMASCVLEVLGGARSPTGAAQELGLSIQRYYLLETRALKGLVDACEARPRGRVASPEREMESLRKEAERLKRECARQQALVRAAQRTIGLAPAVSPKCKGPPGGRRKHRPAVRALKAVERMKALGEEVLSPPAP